MEFETTEKEQIESFVDEPLDPYWLKNEKSSSDGINEKFSDRIYITGQNRVLQKELVKLIDSAREVVCAASFMLSEENIIEAFLRASKRGVRVYLLTSSEARLSKDPSEDDEFGKRMIEEHKELLDKLSGKALLRTAPHLHSKFILTDPNSSDGPKGFLVTANLATLPLTRNPEIGIKLNPEEGQELFKQFCIGFWKESKRELLEKGNLKAVNNNLDIDVPTLSENSKILCTMKDITTIKDKLLELIDDSDGNIWACSYGFQESHPVMKSIFSALDHGRDVTVIARHHRFKTKDALISLAERGAKVFGLSWIHAKCIVVEGGGNVNAVVMTANIEDNGLDTGFETGVWLSGPDASNLLSLLKKWAKNSQLKLETNKKRGEVLGPIMMFKDGEFKEITIEPKFEHDFGEIKVKAKSKNKIKNARPKNFPRPDKDNVIYHEHIYKWRVSVPKASKNNAVVGGTE